MELCFSMDNARSNIMMESLSFFAGYIYEQTTSRERNTELIRATDLLLSLLIFFYFMFWEIQVLNTKYNYAS